MRQIIGGDKTPGVIRQERTFMPSFSFFFLPGFASHSFPPLYYYLLSPSPPVCLHFKKREGEGNRQLQSSFSPLFNAPLWRGFGFADDESINPSSAEKLFHTVNPAPF